MALESGIYLHESEHHPADDADGNGGPFKTLYLLMSGFGALRNGLQYADSFGYIACLSGAVHIFEYPLDKPGRNIIGEDACFGDIRAAALTYRNPRVAAQALFDRIKTSGDTLAKEVHNEDSAA